MVIDPAFWKDRSVLVTGHTGFKGGWLSVWLNQLEASVHGYALDPPTDPSFYEQVNLGSILTADARGDVADLPSLSAAIKQAQPEIVFHLAAQPLVRASYDKPIRTLMDNVMGTAHLLEAVRGCDSVRAVVVITTDKVYENREWLYPYRESDPLGGHDPYSASKAAAELVTASLRDSFFGPAGHPARVATARAGNVIGGGDWAMDRLVPDCLRAFAQNQAVVLRQPEAVRPWQHVLEPLSGYLLIAQHLCDNEISALAAWNFGPGPANNQTVGVVAELMAKHWGVGAEVRCESETEAPHEAGQLRLDSSQAQIKLGWHPRWRIEDAVEHTLAWYKAWLNQDDLLALTRRQIEAYAVSEVAG